MKIDKFSDKCICEVCDLIRSGLYIRDQDNRLHILDLSKRFEVSVGDLVELIGWLKLPMDTAVKMTESLEDLDFLEGYFFDLCSRRRAELSQSVVQNQENDKPFPGLNMW